MASEPPSIQVVIEYLSGRSEAGLKNFRTIKLNRSANLRKQIFQVAELWVEEVALELLAQWLIDHGAELVELLSSPKEPKQLLKSTPENRFHESLTKPYRYEFWRSEKRHEKHRTSR